MSHTRGGRSFAHVERSYLDNDQGEHREHGYEYVEHQSRYMPTRPANTSIMRL
jgi:hypothetical protein